MPVAMAKLDFLEKAVRRGFQRYSVFLCRHPVAMFFIPLVCTAGFGVGFLSFSFRTDTEYLFTPQNSRADAERRSARELFPVDYDNVTLNRLTESDQRRISVIITALEGESVLTTRIMDEVYELASELKNITILSDDGQVVDYTVLCGRWNGECIGNDVLKYYAFKRLQNGQATTVEFPYPYGIISETEVMFMEPYIGGGHVVNNTYTSAKSVLLIYLLRNDGEDMDELSEQWENRALEVSASFGSSLANVSMLSSESLDETQRSIVTQVLPYFYATCTGIAVFAVLSCLMLQDAVQSKPLLGLLGVLTPCLAIISVFGVLSASGIEFNSVVLSTPFLVIGIGLDNMFVMLAAWRRTSPHLSVETRIRDTYTEAAVSITITSVTDCLAFCIGALTPLPAIRIFCLFTALAIVFNFVYHVTFWGSCLVLFGHMEAHNRHSITFRRVSFQVQTNSSSKFRFSCCSGGVAKTEFSNGKNDDCKHSLMLFFRDRYAGFIVRLPVIVATAACYLVYISVAMAGCTKIEQGLHPRHLTLEGSETYNFLSHQSEYFVKFGSSVSVIIQEPLQYWKMTTQLGDMLHDFHESEYIQPENYTQCWFLDFEKFLQKLSLSPPSSEQYLQLLRENFLVIPQYSEYLLDINFRDDEQIDSSRCILSTTYQSDANGAVAMMKNLRSIADNHSNKLGWSITIFSTDFIFFEQYAIILPVTIQTVSIAMATMMLVALLLIPHPVVSVLVTLSVASTMTGVVGFMTFWDVALNSLTMITLILSVGFSVDFSAHMAYSFVVTQADHEPHARLAGSLHALGYPILQCGVSTILSVCSLMLAPSYVYQAFAKILILVTGFGMLHGLLILPTAMWIYSYYSTNRSRVAPAPDQETPGEQVMQDRLDIISVD